MRHITSITQLRPLPAQVHQGACLSVLEIVLNLLVNRLENKKAEKEANPA